MSTDVKQSQEHERLDIAQEHLELLSFEEYCHEERSTISLPNLEKQQSQIDNDSHKHVKHDFIDNSKVAVELASNIEEINLPPSTFTSGGFSSSVKEPKGYVSGFNFFAVRVRSTMKDQLSHLSNNEANKVIGRLWRDLANEKKAPYLKRSEEDKIRYFQELHMYNTFHGGNTIPKIDPPPGYGLDGRSLHINTAIEARAIVGGVVPGVISIQPAKNHRGRKRKNAIQTANRSQDSLLFSDSQPPIVMRPRTAYSLFAHQERMFLSGIKCSDMQRAMGRYLGKRWKNIDPEERRLYEALSNSGAQTK